MNQGKLIVATPSILGDFNFRRSVILLASQKTSGSIGFILNKKLHYKLNDVVEDINIKFPLFYGGPVEQDNLFYLHRLGNVIPDSIEINSSLSWNGDFKFITKLINENKLKVNDIRFFLGCSSWSNGQLEKELDEKSWEPFEIVSSEKVLKMKIQNMWQKCMISLGGKYRVWSNAPENPNFN
ncbi:transcriptional regulator [Bacteroidetes bacterium SCGC AAA795-G10]|nr:transcriptional regulator [Bacteroidetes bacterium SCGC AAA795-G10]